MNLRKPDNSLAKIAFKCLNNKIKKPQGQEGQLGNYNDENKLKWL